MIVILRSLVRLCDVMDESTDSTDTSTGMQQIRYCEYMLNLISKDKANIHTHHV